MHGFDGHTSRGNLAYSKDGKVVYTTAGVAIVQTLEKKKDNQMFFNHHREDSEDIVAMAMHPDGDVIATGSMATKADKEVNYKDICLNGLKTPKST